MGHFIIIYLTFSALFFASVPPNSSAEEIWGKKFPSPKNLKALTSDSDDETLSDDDAKELVAVVEVSEIKNRSAWWIRDLWKGY